MYWYAVLLLQPTLYLVSAPDHSYGPGMGELGREDSKLRATTGAAQPALLRPAGAGRLGACPGPLGEARWGADP